MPPKPDRPTFYVDHCTGKAVVRALKDAGANVEHHSDHFAQDEEDEVWIPSVAARGWVSTAPQDSVQDHFHGAPTDEIKATNVAMAPAARTDV